MRFVRRQKIMRRRRSAVLGLASVIAVLAVCLVSLLSATAASSARSGGVQTVEIGYLAELTGSLANDSKLGVEGANLAIQQLNARSGRTGFRYKLKIADVGEGQPDIVAKAVQGFTDDSSIKAVVAEQASTTNFEIVPLAKAKMPYLVGANSAQTASIVAKDPSQFDTVWSMAPSYAGYGTALPQKVDQWVKQGLIKLPSRSAYIITSDNPYSQGISTGLIKTMKKLGWKLSGQQTVPLATINDWGSVLAKIRTTNPGLIVNTDYQVGNEATFMRQFMQNPTKSLMFIQYGPSVPQFIQLLKDSSTGVLYNLLLGALNSPKWPRGYNFIRAFKARYHSDPGSTGGVLYDEINLYAAALQKVKNPDNKEAIGKAIGRMHMIATQGHLAFDPKTHLALQNDQTTPLQFFQIWHGKRILLSPSWIANGKIHQPPWMKVK